jgi:hypothetical protein
MENTIRQSLAVHTLVAVTFSISRLGIHTHHPLAFALVAASVKSLAIARQTPVNAALPLPKSAAIHLISAAGCVEWRPPVKSVLPLWRRRGGRM